jgi:hypothetical protein
MTDWHVIHVTALALWGGVLLVEVLMEVLGLRFAHLRDGIAELHRYIDWFTEVPLLAAVTLSGAVMLQGQTWDLGLMLKVGGGLVAVLGTVWATHGVMIRARGQAAAPDQYLLRTLWILGPAALVGPAFGLALYLGGTRGGWW